MAQRRGLVRIAALSRYQPVADRLELDTRPLLKAAGLTPSILSEPEQFVPAEPVIALLEESARLSGCATFGLQMSLGRPISDGGMISVLIALQPSLEALLRTASRYRNSICPILVLSVERHDDIAMITADVSLASDRPHRQTNEYIVGVLVAGIRTILGQSWFPEGVYLAYPDPLAADRTIYHAAFGSNVQFNANFNGMTVTLADLERQRDGADPGLARHARTLLQPHLDAEAPSFIQKVEQAIIYLLGAGRATLPETAALLRIHPRTLQRRLDQEGVNYRQLVHQTRVQLAARFLSNHNLSVAEVAEALGYSSTGAFSRWHRHEMGRSPRHGRALASR